MFPKTSQNLTNNFYFQTWGILYLITLLCYSPFLINFLWGNHDWQWIKEYTPLLSGVFEGRFSQFILPTILLEGNILPILSLACGLAFYTISAILLFKMWNIPNTKIFYIVLGLNLVTSPYTISWLYFAFITLSCLSWPFFIIFSFWLLRQKTSYCNIILSIIFLTLSLGGYPPVINLIFTLLFTFLLTDLTTKKNSLQTIIRNYTLYASIIFCSIIIFLTIQTILKKYGLQQATYNTASITLSGLTNKINLILKAISEQFIITTSFITNFYKYTWLGITLYAIFVLYRQTPKKLIYQFLFFASLLGLFCAPLITLIVAENSIYVQYEPRIDFFGLLYIYIFSASILLKSQRLIHKNLAIFLLTTLIFYNFHTTSYASKVWKQGFSAEAKLSERIISRIENNKIFSPQNKYTFVQGGTLDFRSKYYLADTATKIDSYTLIAPYIPWHLPSKAYKFYQPTDFFGNDFDIFWSYVNPSYINITPELAEYLATNATPWPQENAIHIDNTSIILTLTPQGKELAKQWLQNL